MKLQFCYFLQTLKKKSLKKRIYHLSEVASNHKSHCRITQYINTFTFNLLAAIHDLCNPSVIKIRFPKLGLNNILVSEWRHHTIVFRYLTASRHTSVNPVHLMAELNMQILGWEAQITPCKTWSVTLGLLKNLTRCRKQGFNIIFSSSRGIQYTHELPNTWHDYTGEYVLFYEQGILN